MDVCTLGKYCEFWTVSIKCTQTTPLLLEGCGLLDNAYVASVFDS